MFIRKAAFSLKSERFSNNLKKKFEFKSSGHFRDAKEIGYNKDRVAKDLSQYRNNLSRIKEAFELIKVASDETKRRLKDKK